MSCTRIRRNNLLISFVVLLVGIYVTLRSQTVQQGVQNGLVLCSDLIIPSLFVFLCFCEWMVASGCSDAVTYTFRWFFRLLMGRWHSSGTAWLLCLLGGYPAGASALLQLHQQNQLTQNQAKRLACLLFTPSPAFVITGVGAGMLGSMRAGFILWAACTLSALLTVAVGCRLPCREALLPAKEMERSNQTNAFVTAVSRASHHMITICGMVMLFSVVGLWIEQLPLPRWSINHMIGMLEITNGCVRLSHQSLPVLGMVLSFGGVCTHMQNKAILGDLMPRYPLFFAIRLLQSLVTYGIAWGLCQLLPLVQPTMVASQPTLNTTRSLLPSVFLWITCVAFLYSLYIGKEKRRIIDEESRLYP